MKKNILIISGLAAAFCAGYFLGRITRTEPENKIEVAQPEKADTLKKDNHIKIGAFSISISVKDLTVSKKFYENLGFTVFGGGMDKNYLIMKNGNSLVGLFQGMFEGNMLTFNPGWDENAKNVDPFTDIREIQKHLKTKNVAQTLEADEKTTGPASIMLTDPDGNVILVDQHR